MRWIVMTLLCCRSAYGAEQDNELFLFQPVSSQVAIVHIDVGHRATRPVSQLLYGKFAEHLGRNIYRGMWAQLLVNSGFESKEVWGQRAERIGSELAWRLDTPALADAAKEGLPPGWIALSHQNATCRPVPNSRTGRQSLRLEATDPDAGVGVWQPVDLPLGRQTGYDWSLFVRSEEDVRILVRLRSASDSKIHAEQSVPVVAGPWKQYQGHLSLPAAAEKDSERLRWEIELTGSGRIWIDQSLLFPSDHLEGWDPDVVRFVKESQLPLLRWPGGNFASGYHWKDGIGPIDDRPVRINRPWNQPEPNHVGTDEFMRFCELAGAEPMICANAGDGTAEEAAEWVEYCNGSVNSPLGKLRAAHGHPEPFHVRYWEIGNELYGRWQIGHCTAEQYAERYRRFVEAMRQRDPSIRFIANGNDARWNQVLVNRCSDILSCVSVHTLIGGGMPPDTDPEKVWWLVVGYPWNYQQHLESLSSQLRQRVSGGTVAITELQVFTNRASLPNNGSLAEALFWAGIVHTAMRVGDRVELITHSALVNHGGGLRKVRQVVFGNPVYWARRMYSTQPGRWPVAVRLEGPAFTAERIRNLPGLKNAPVLDVMALTDDSRQTLTVLAINRHAQNPLPVEIQLAGFTAAPTARWQWLTGQSLLAANSLEEPNAVCIQEKRVSVERERLHLTLPARSVSVLTLSARH